MEEAKIKIGTFADVDAYVAHILRYGRENGREGVYFSPHPASHEPDPLKLKAEIGVRWTRRLDELGWERAFLVFLGNEVIGHLDLVRGAMPPNAHRVRLGMVLEYAHKGRGLGERLMQAAIEFARAQAAIDWIDLGVFVGNERAKKLYERHGFVETGRVQDMFRVGDIAVDDIQMSLRLK